MQNSEARKRHEEQLSLFDEPHESATIAVQEVLTYLERIRALLLVNDDQGAFTYTDIVIKALKSNEL